MNSATTNLVLPDHLAAWMLLGMLSVVFVLLVVFTALVLQLARRRRMEGAMLLRHPAESAFDLVPAAPRLFHELPARWLAVRANRPGDVQKALHLANPIPCPLAEGLTSSGELELFVSPPIGGWILVTGSEVPDPTDDVDACFLWLRELSSQLGEVQFFAANRALGHHAWARLLSGEVFRAYAWAGETLWTQGEPTRAELDLKMECTGYGEQAVDYEFKRKESGLTNVEKVALLAARWSLDPASIDLARHWPRRGIAGHFSPH